MKTIKFLLFGIVLLLSILLCGCEWFHTHDYVWVNGEDYQKAYLRCKICYMPFDPDKLYEEPVKIRGSIEGDPSFSSLIYYEIYVDSGHYYYGEEFDITLKIEIEKNYIELGEFSVMLSESPYFEFIGDKEQTVLITEEDYNQFREFKFRIKATATCNTPQDFEFKLKFNDNKYFKRDAAVDWGQLPWYYLPDEEYFYGFKHLSFINDSHGMFLEDSRGGWLFNNSVNREYLSGTLDKDKYMDRCLEYATDGAVSINVDNNKNLCYWSKNIRAKFIITDKEKWEYLHLLNSERENNPECGVILANELLAILYSNDFITTEQYNIEVELLASKGVSPLKRSVGITSYVPFSEYYSENLFDFVYDETILARTNFLYENSEGSLTSINLECDKIFVWENVNVVVNTNFIDNIKDCEIIIAEGLYLNSEIDFADDKIVFSLSYNEEYLNPHFKLKINFDAKEADSIEINVYGYIEGDCLYLSQWSANEAYKVFCDYQKEAQYTNSPSILDIQNMITTSANVRSINSAVSGTFSWKDSNNNIFPAQFCIVSFYDRDAIEEVYLGSCLTNENGEYTFYFTNESYLEGAGMDITVRLWAAGEDVSVIYKRDLILMEQCYYDDYELPDNLEPGFYHNISRTYEMENLNQEPNLFAQALQICQAAIFASRYYEEMKGSDVVNVPIVYPHKENSQNCFYDPDCLPYGRINILGHNTYKVYEAWDVIMHEYGHFVSDKEGFDNSLGGWHDSVAMSEHYQMHFSNGSRTNCSKSSCAYNQLLSFTATEANCKINGTSIAFSEGWATYFAMVSQEYYSEFLNGINNVADKRYTSYTLGSGSVVAGKGRTEDMEVTVYSILYDLYDSNNNDDFGNDDLSLGHRGIWSLVASNGVTTLSELSGKFKEIYNNKEQIKKYGQLLSYHNLASGDIYDDNAGAMVPAITVDGTLSTACPTFLWKWEEIENNLFFSDRTFVLNFYNESFELIGSTPEQTKDARSVTISETLWQAVLDSGSKFYVSVTVIENHSPKTEYEGQWYEFEVSTEIATVNERTRYTLSLPCDEYYWCSFTAPCSTTYTFKTSGTIDTNGAVFDNVVAGESFNEALAYNDNYNGDTDFSFKLYITAGETVYIRIGINGETTEESFDFWIFGEHNFTSSYTPNDLYGHTAYCECGAITYESHDWEISEISSCCRLCLYITQRTVVPVFKSSVEEEEQILYYDDKKEENE